MAQREFPCPACGTVIAVPDHYFSARIACAACGALADRRSGKAFQAQGADLQQDSRPMPPATQPSPQPAPIGMQMPRPVQAGPQYPMPGQPGPYYPMPGQAVPQYPMPDQAGPQYPMPGQPGPYYPMPGQAGPQYPMPGFPGAQYPFPGQTGTNDPYAPPRKSRTGLVIGLVAGGVAVTVGLIVLMVVAVGRLVDGGPMPEYAEWHTHKSREGMYEARFPSSPQLSSETEHSELGLVTTYTALNRRGGVTFEVAYFDLGNNHPDYYEFDADEGAAAIADAVSGRVTNKLYASRGGLDGKLYSIAQSNGLESQYFLARTGNRVFTVGANAYAPDKAPIVDYFLVNWKYVGRPQQPERDLPPTNAPDHFTNPYGQPPYIHCDEPERTFKEGATVNFSIGVMSGARPAKLSVTDDTLPTGLQITIDETRFRIHGTLARGAQSGRVCLVATDAIGRSDSRWIVIHVAPE